MPVRLRFSLNGPVPRTPHIHAAGVYRLVLDWLEAGQAGVSQPLHDANQVKPISIGPPPPNPGMVWGPNESDDDPKSLVNRSRFDVGVLVDHLLMPLLAGAARTSVVCLGEQQYKLCPSQVIGHSSWDGLMSEAPRSEWEFVLRSPLHITIRQGRCRRTVVLPDPALYFGSWLGRWNLCCENVIDPTLLDIVRTGVEVAACDGRTHSIGLPRGRKIGAPHKPAQFTGFVGTVRFRAIPAAGVSAEALQHLTALAMFASFCGTGVDTMRGMGETVYCV